ncbi:hypothetical protein LMG23994_03652 [Cupriavidus pinatubonensis]|uniref:Lipoprotein n=1 Tax=Cupriavidus pinatubonensis TaxID=248026 RepID=A0ABM8XBN5_9BURK|nr:hypothetical protein LMG23994_03652 [Cupriavidus pinatubonensis]
MSCRASYALCLAMVLMSGCGREPEKSPAPQTGAAGSSDASAAAASPRADDLPPLGRPGRFQIVSNAQARGGAFLLDTQAGRVWQLRDFPGLQGAPSAWQEMTIIDDKSGMGVTTAQFQKLYPQRQLPPSRQGDRHRR